MVTPIIDSVFLPPKFATTWLPVKKWDDLEPIYQELQNRPILSAAELEDWIVDRNALEIAVYEEFGWRYIRLTTNTQHETAIKEYEYFVQQISPQASAYEFQLNKKLFDSPYAQSLEKEQYRIYLREINDSSRLFREENIALIASERLQAKHYGTLFSKIVIPFQGVDLTLQQALGKLEESDRATREQAFKLVHSNLGALAVEVEGIFDDLRAIRLQIANNAGFSNYRDYRFQHLGRFDYSPQDCLDFHESIRTTIVPIVTAIHERRKRNLQLEELRPWDLNVDPMAQAPLQPFCGEQELMEKSIRLLHELHPLFGQCIERMRQAGHLDLESRPNKRHGGYNMPLTATGISFIFMNATGSVGDMRTFMHESGHAVHALLTRALPLITAKRPPAEIAELAAMTMELLTMDLWHHFFPLRQDLLRAQIWQLENILQLLPWIATIDQFQHWIYTHPDHTAEERRQCWLTTMQAFSTPIINRAGLDDYVACAWYRQLHLFEAPFYYVEYGMAQLGAIAIWKRYREQGSVALNDFIAALSLGYTKSIPEVYATAGITFQFSVDYVSDLAQFINKELDSLLKEQMTYTRDRGNKKFFM